MTLDDKTHKMNPVNLFPQGKNPTETINEHFRQFEMALETEAEESLGAGDDTSKYLHIF